MRISRWPGVVLLVLVLISALVFLVGRRIYAQHYRGNILDKSPLTSEPCAPPCWQGMRPGDEMTLAEVEQRLEEIPSVGNIAVVEGLSSVKFTWRRWPGESPVSPPVYKDINTIHTKEGIISSISLIPDFVVTVEDIVTWYGEPPATEVYYMPVTEGPFILVRCSYPEQGVYFTLEYLSSSDEPRLENATQVALAEYREPLSFSAWVTQRSEASDGFQWHPWPGYGSVEDLAG